MKTDAIIQRSIYIITEYYKNDLEPFFSSIGEDILWLGPARGQLMRGRDNLIRAWAAEDHSLTFTMGDIRALCISPHAHVKEVLLQYEIFTHFPNGYTDRHEQRLHYTWVEKRKDTPAGKKYSAEIAMIHISNLWQYDSRDNIYPVHYEELSASQSVVKAPERYVTVKADNMSMHRIAAGHILYIETVKRAAKLRVHTETGDVTVSGTLPGFEQEYPGLFLRIHASYLINPAQVREVRRFSVTLSDGTELPIPEKKYTRIKKLLLREDADA